jgi:transcriptional regulator with XRE-family HTH domain
VPTLPKLGRGLGAAVREARLRRGWSQEELAEIAGLDRTYISGLERGARNPALTTIERVAESLAIPVSRLFSEAEGMGSQRERRR